MEDPGKTKSIISLVCGIVGLLASFGGGVIGIALGIAAIILAVKSGNESQAAGFNRSGMAVAGLVLGIISLVIGVPVFICSLVYIGVSGAMFGCYACIELPYYMSNYN